MAATAIRTGGRRRQGMSAHTRRSLIKGLLFVSPWLVGLLLLTLYPIGASLYYSFTAYDVFTDPVWVGLENFQTAIAGDENVALALTNTFLYALVFIPLSQLAALFSASLLNVDLKGQSIFRTFFYLPSIVPAVASTIVWIWLFNPQYGIINMMLRLVGIPGPGWFVSPQWAMPAYILMSLWGVGGGIVIYLASLQDVPKELKEAAELDGAGAWRRFLNVTLPMISPVIFFNVIMGIIGAFQVFAQVFIITGSYGAAGPGNRLLFYSLYLYRQSFQAFKMGYASALAWILFVIIMALTLIVFKSSARYVYYAGEK